MKGIVLLIVGIILLLGAGVGGWVVYTKFMAPPPGHEAEKPKPPPEPPPIYIRVPPLILPVIGSDRVEQQITIVVTLEVADQSAANKVQEKMPWIADTFFTTLYGAIDEGQILTGSLVNIPGVKQKLLTAGGRLVGKGTIKEVLVQTVLQRKL